MLVALYLKQGVVHVYLMSVFGLLSISPNAFHLLLTLLFFLSSLLVICNLDHRCDFSDDILFTHFELQLLTLDQLLSNIAVRLERKKTNWLYGLDVVPIQDQLEYLNS